MKSFYGLIAFATAALAVPQNYESYAPYSNYGDYPQPPTDDSTPTRRSPQDYGNYAPYDTYGDYAPYDTYGDYPQPSPSASAPARRSPQDYGNYAPYDTYGDYPQPSSDASAPARRSPQDYGSYAPYSTYGSYGNAPYSTYGTYGNAPDVTFTLSNILYNSSYSYSTPAHLATKSGQLSFDLTNSAVGYTTKCYSYSTWEFEFYYGNIVYQCAVPAGQAAGANANYTFNSINGAFNVNQTFASGGSNYLAFGTGTANLDCTTDKYQNPNWSIGQIYSTTSKTCKPATLTIKAQTVGA